MTDWKLYKLGDIAGVQNGYAFKSGDFSTSGIPVIKIKNIVSPYVFFDDAVYYNKTVEKRLEKFLVKKGDVLISMTGSTVNQMSSAVGKIGRYQFEFPAFLNQRVGKIYITDPKIADYDYLYHYINRFDIQYNLALNATGSANQANISPEQIKNVDIFLPPLKEQQAIAEILSSLDDKIELNLQMNKTLEEMAMTLYKEWFVDFGPFKDGAFVESELGLIPEGWEICSVSDISQNKKQTVTAKKIKADVRYIGLEHMTKGSITIDSFGYGSDITSNKFQFKRGDILFGKLRPYFKKVGIAPYDGVCSTDILVIAPKENVYFGFLLALLIQPKFIEFVSNASSGTRMPRASWELMNKYKFCQPKEKRALEPFNDNIVGASEQILSNIIENELLRKTRDTLLPKLISGEIRLKEFEKEIAEII